VQPEHRCINHAGERVSHRPSRGGDCALQLADVFFEGKPLALEHRDQSLLAHLDMSP